MGIEYCHKSRANAIKHSYAKNQTSACAFFILHLCPLAQYCGLPGEKQLERAQSPLEILSPARACAECSLAPIMTTAHNTSLAVD